MIGTVQNELKMLIVYVEVTSEVPTYPFPIEIDQRYLSVHIELDQEPVIGGGDTEDCGSTLSNSQPAQQVKRLTGFVDNLHRIDRTVD